MSGSKCWVARETNACKVSKKSDPLTMWQTLSTPSASLTLLSTVITHMSSCKGERELRRRIWSKHRPHISINNAEMQRRSESLDNTSKMLSSKSADSTTRITSTTMPATVGINITRRCSCHSLRPNNSNTTSKISILHCVLLLCILCDAAQATLRNVNLLVEPPAVRRGQSVVLRCEYQLDGAPLYSIKFYRGQLEFYRFTPGEYPHTKVFQYPGIKVDESSSNATLVHIRNVSFGLSGNFSCEVTADAPLYSTATAYAQMQVVEFPEKRPQLFTEITRYEPGDVLRANCSTPPSRPRAELRFTINHMPVSTEETQYIRTVDNLIASRLSLKLQLQAVHFVATATTTNSNGNINGNTHGRAANVHMTNALVNGKGGLMLRCTAQIGDLYQEYKEIELGSPQKDPVPARVTLSSDSGLRNFFETYIYNSAAGRTDVVGSVLLGYLIVLFWIIRIGS
ncbi:uncharacterized protein LOC117575100 isoform X1 [Drosophila albomicans]|uniref:Uncharacterized protein LOC117575100 isoform X1 n=1 Tax=Drosophila albomicans TaxID=7291 RepID=A0A6P8ZDR1_DROAB|nr:uncharacterized protein LOC117575100 isoform X1 [Drosophila albomicans]